MWKLHAIMRMDPPIQKVIQKLLQRVTPLIFLYYNAYKSQTTNCFVIGTGVIQTDCKCIVLREARIFGVQMDRTDDQDILYRF